MGVKKIFILLITIVACVSIGAFVLNILLPNVTETLVDATEKMVYNATGMDFDWNGNGKSGGTHGTTFDGDLDETNDPAQAGGNVDGFR